MNLKTKYRIVTDTSSGYEAQLKKWWWPYWWQMGLEGSSVNTHCTIESAEKYIQRHKHGRVVVKEIQ